MLALFYYVHNYFLVKTHKITYKIILTEMLMTDFKQNCKYLTKHL